MSSEDTDSPPKQPVLQMNSGGNPVNLLAEADRGPDPVVGNVGETAESVPSVTIIIPSRDSEPTLSRCIDSVLNLDYPRELVEIIVVDASEKPPVLPASQQKRVQVFHRKCSAPAAYNFALKISRGDVIGFIDSDAFADPEWLRNLVRPLDDESVGGVGGMIKTWNSDNPLARAIGYELEKRYARMPREILRISTANLVVRKRVLDRIHGVREDFPTGYDATLGQDINHLGLKLLFEPDAVVFHYHRPTIRSFFKQQATYAENDVRLYSSDFQRGRDNVTGRSMLLELVAWSLLPLGLLAWALLLLIGQAYPSVVLGYAITLVFAVMIVTVLVRAISASLSNRDPAALLWLSAILLIRPYAWTKGALTGALAGIRGDKDASLPH